MTTFFTTCLTSSSLLYSTLLFSLPLLLLHLTSFLLFISPLLSSFSSIFSCLFYFSPFLFYHLQKIKGEFGTSTDTGSRKKNQVLFEEATLKGCTVVKNVHTDWITRMLFLSDLDLLLVSSSGERVWVCERERESCVRV